MALERILPLESLQSDATKTRLSLVASKAS
jgi:hypothetical protein